MHGGTLCTTRVPATYRAPRPVQRCDNEYNASSIWLLLLVVPMGYAQERMVVALLSEGMGARAAAEILPLLMLASCMQLQVGALQK